MKHFYLFLIMLVSQPVFSMDFPFQFRSDGEKNAFKKIEGGSAIDFFRCALYAGEIKLEKQFENAVSDFELFLKQIELKIKGKRGSKEVKLIQKMILKKYGKKQSDGSSFHEMALFSIANEHSLAYTMSLVLAHFKIPFLMEETRTKTKVIALEGMDQVVFEFYYNTVKTGPNEKTAERFMQIFREGGFITGSKDWPFVQKEFEKAYYTGGDENIKKALSSVYNMCFWNLITN